jgi:6-phosphofructokinase 1
VAGVGGRAGAMLRTSRADKLLEGSTSERYEHFTSIIHQLSGAGVRILYVIGGEGSMKAAHAIWKISRDIRKPISVVGIPKTMDNDILWVWQSFGFLSAVEQARTAILNLHTEATSNPRVCVIQLFGSDSGFVVSHAALASGVCDAALVPEVGFSIKGESGLSQYICRRLNTRLMSRSESPSALIVMAETAIPLDALDYVNDESDQCEIELTDGEKKMVREFFKGGRRVQGQTSDLLRSAGLKIVSKALQKDIRDMQRQNSYWEKYRVFSNEPRHLIRSIAPSVADVIIGERLGTLAVDSAMAGYTDFMVSQWLTEYVLVPLKLVILGRKRVPEKGMFWKSVLDSTGQPESLVDSQ